MEKTRIKDEDKCISFSIVLHIEREYLLKCVEYRNLNDLNDNSANFRLICLVDSCAAACV